MSVVNWIKSLVFGSEIIRTIGQVNEEQGSLYKRSLQVHLLKNKDLSTAPLIGIELTAKTILSYQMLPIVLNIGEVHRLIDLLEEALKQK